MTDNEFKSKLEKILADVVREAAAHNEKMNSMPNDTLLQIFQKNKSTLSLVERHKSWILEFMKKCTKPHQTLYVMDLLEKFTYDIATTKRAIAEQESMLRYEQALNQKDNFKTFLQHQKNVKVN